MATAEVLTLRAPIIRSPRSPRSGIPTSSSISIASHLIFTSSTLQRWVAEDKAYLSQRIKHGGFTLWRWTDSYVERVRKYKQEDYRKRRGHKPRRKR